MEAFVVFLAFTRPGCPPCSQYKKDFAGDLSVQVIDITESPEIAKKYNVNRVPTIVATSVGKEVDRTVGYSGKQNMQDWMEAARKKANSQ